MPNLQQVVTKPTHKHKILDVLFLNNYRDYDVPEISSEVLADNMNTHKKSDHLVPIVRPLKGKPSGKRNIYKVIKYRPLPESSVRGFVSEFLKQDWNFMSTENPTKQVDLVHKYLNEKVDKFFPEKCVKISNKDKPFITSELKVIDRKSEKYKSLNKELKNKHKKAASEYLKKNVSQLKNSNPGKAAATLNRYAVNQCEYDEDKNFTLTSHAEENLSDEEQLERIANFFASIASEFPRLKPDELPSDIRDKLNNINQEQIPTISSKFAYKISKSIKKKKEFCTR